MSAIIAKRYSKALVSLAGDDQELQSFSEHLAEITTAFTQDESLSLFFSNPKVLREEKLKIATDVLNKGGFHKHVINLIRLLISRGRLPVLSDVNRDFEKLTLERLNLAKLTVISAEEIDSEGKKKLISKAEKSFGKKILPNFEVDPDILGGIVLKIGSTEIDGSIKNYFHQLQKTIL